MRTPFMWSVAALAALVTTHDAFADAPAAAGTVAIGTVPMTLTIQDGYELIELTALTYEKSGATVISATGRIGGAFTISSSLTAAALWEPNGTGTAPQAARPSQVVGFMPNGEAVGYVLPLAGISYQGFEGGKTLQNVPLGVGPQGKIVGMRQVGNDVIEPYAYPGNGNPSVLKPVAGFPVAIPWSVNAHGVSVGYAAAASTQGTPGRPVRWSPNGTPTFLPGKGAQNHAYAFAVNGNGVIIGSAGDPATERAAKWENDQLFELGGFGGKSSAASINSAGVIVGYGEDADGNRRGFVYRGGKLIDLNTLIDRPAVTKAYTTAKTPVTVDRAALLASDWVVQAANSINDKGEICGYASKLGKVRAVVLRPVERTITIMTPDDVNKGIKASTPPRIEVGRQLPLKK